MTSNKVWKNLLVNVSRRKQLQRLCSHLVTQVLQHDTLWAHSEHGKATGF